MSMLHLRVVCPAEQSERVLAVLNDSAGVIAVLTDGESADGPVISADVSRESGHNVLRGLERCGIREHGMVSLEPLDTAFGQLVDTARSESPGESADAVIWDELNARTGEDSALSWTFLSFMVLAILLATIGVVTDSPITLVGAMIVGPEFGALAGLCVGVVRRRAQMIRSAALALAVGFPTALIAAALFSLGARALGLIHPHSITAVGRHTEFIYHPGWFSLITALIAGVAGMLSLTSSRSTALVGVFVSVTTIPAAGNAAVASVLGHWHEAALSVAQLGINLVGIVVAGVVTVSRIDTAQRLLDERHDAAPGAGRGVRGVRGVRRRRPAR